MQEELLRRNNFNRRDYGSLELVWWIIKLFYLDDVFELIFYYLLKLFTLDREGIIQNIGKFRIEKGDCTEVIC